MLRLNKRYTNDDNYTVTKALGDRGATTTEKSLLPAVRVGVSSPENL